MAVPKFDRREIEEIEGWLNSPTFADVFEEIELRFTATWKAARTTEDREYCWRMIQCVNQVMSEIKGMVSTQKIDEFNASRARANDWSLPRQGDL